MSSEEMGRLGEAFIPLIGGVYGTLYGFRKIGKKPGVDPSYDAKMKKIEKDLKICGPLVLLFGVFLLIRAIFCSA